MFENTNDSRSMIQDFEKESDSLYNYSDNLMMLKSVIWILWNMSASAMLIARLQRQEITPITAPTTVLFSQSSSQSQDDKDYERSKEMIRMLNESQQPTMSSKQEKEEKEYEPL